MSKENNAKPSRKKVTDRFDTSNDLELASKLIPKKKKATKSQLDSLLSAEPKDHNNATKTLKMPISGKMVTFSFKYVPLNKLVVAPENERIQSLLDATSVSDILPSIRLSGVDTPLVSRPSGDMHEIVDGSRRFYAAQLAELDQLPIWHGEIPDEDIAAMSALGNQNKPISYYEKAITYQRLIDNAHYSSWNHLAACEGLSNGQRSRYKALVELDPIFVKALTFPSDMHLKYGEQINALLKIDSAAVKDMAEKIVSEKEKNLTSEIEGSCDRVLKLLRRSVSKKASSVQPSTTNLSSKSGVQVIHSKNEKGEIKFQVKKATEEQNEHILNFIKDYLKLE